MRNPIPTCPPSFATAAVTATMITTPTPAFKIANVNVNVNVNKLKGLGPMVADADGMGGVDTAELEAAVSNAIRTAIGGTPA